MLWPRTIIAGVEIPAGFRQCVHPRGFAVVRDELAAIPPEAWWAAGDALPGASGRGAVVVLDLGAHGRGVARDYRRGGALRGEGRGTGELRH